MFFALLQQTNEVVGVWPNIVYFVQSFALSVLTLWSLAFFCFWGVVFIICIYQGAVKDEYWPTGVILLLVFAFLWIAGATAPFQYVANNPGWASLYVCGYLVVAAVWMTFRWLRLIEKIRWQRAEAIRDYLKDKYPLVSKEYLDSQGAAGDEKRRAGDLKEKTKEVFAQLLELPTQTDQFEEESEVVNDSNQADDSLETWYYELVETGYAPEEPWFMTDNLNRHAFGNGRKIGTATQPPTFSEHKTDFFAYFFYWPLDMLIYVFGEFLRDAWKYVVKVVQRAYDSYAEKRTKQKINL